MTVNDFTTQKKISCVGCWFNRKYKEKAESELHKRDKTKHDILCTSPQYESLIIDLWHLYGSCLTNGSIFILKEFNQCSLDYEKGISEEITNNTEESIKTMVKV
jgi:hypothetical protein